MASVIHSDTDLPVPTAKEYLRENSWALPGEPEDKSFFITDPTLRHLLVHRLRTATLTDSATPDWSVLHQRTRPAAGAAREPVPATDPELDGRRLHHELASGYSSSVVRDLHHLFETVGARPWLRVLSMVCAAPRHPSLHGKRGLPSGRHLAGPADAEEDTVQWDVEASSCPACLPGQTPVHRAISRLVLDLWWQSDPLEVPDPQTIERIGRQLSTLARQSALDDQEVFYEAQKAWPESLRKWAQAPNLPIPGGEA